MNCSRMVAIGDRGLHARKKRPRVGGRMSREDHARPQERRRQGRARDNRARDDRRSDERRRQERSRERLREGLRRQQNRRWRLEEERRATGSSVVPLGCTCTNRVDCTCTTKGCWEGDGPGASSAAPCFDRSRMKRKWLEADRRSDASGCPASETVSTSRARRYWSELVHQVLVGNAVVRIRHHDFDEPALLVRESRFRTMEREAAGGG